jgi:hypothetical protein
MRQAATLSHRPPRQLARQAQFRAAAHAVVHAQVEQARGGRALVVVQRGDAQAEQGAERVSLQRGAQAEQEQAVPVGGRGSGRRD